MNKQTRNALIALGLLGAAVTGVVIATKSSAATPDSPLLPASIIKGHRYKIVLSGSAFSQVDPQKATVPLVQQTFDGVVPVKVISVALAGDTATFVLDYMGETTTPAGMPNSAAVLAQLKSQGITLAITDLGPAP